jgi:adenosylcobinamide-GDP ribazoletransferase
MIPSPHALDLEEIGRLYFCLSPLLGVVNNGIGLLFAYSLVFLGVDTSLAAIGLLVLFYILRGLRHIDGYADLCDGISYRLTRQDENAEKAWQIIRSPARGAFGFLWVGLLLIGQWVLSYHLLNRSLTEMLTIYVLCAASGSLAVLTAHLGKPTYRTDSGFDLMGIQLSRPIQWFILLDVFVVAGIIFWQTEFLNQIGVWLVLFAVLSGLVCGRVLRAIVLGLLKGMNGDFLGFVTLISETVTLFVLLL